MNKLRLSTKLYGGFAVVLIALAAVVSIGYFAINKACVTVGDLVDVHVPLVRNLAVIDAALLAQELAVTQYAVHKEDEFLKHYDEADKEVDNALSQTAKLIAGDQELVDEGWKTKIDQIAEQHDKLFIPAATNLISALKAGKPYEEWDPLADKLADAAKEVMALTDNFIDLNNKETAAVAHKATKTGQGARDMMMIIGLIALVIGILLAFFLTRGIVKPINQIISELKAGSNQVNLASGQVSMASQELAEGSSEQAAALEETSSSLEEISAMTRNNADNSSQADQLMKESGRLIDQAGLDMEEMGRSMDELALSGSEISKIVKSIDEIAFQTNLLALNAAVEAARAGEAGAGFAVVADEVRALAMRAAEAAKSTQELIEGTTRRIEQGSELVSKSREGFDKIANSSGKVAGLVSEVAQASSDQAQGIEQLNATVNQMDRVVQQNAANAEESASAAEELSAQSETLAEMVVQLTGLVEGTNHKDKTGGTDSHHRIATVKPKRKRIPHPSSAKEVIPFDEDELDDF